MHQRYKVVSFAKFHVVKYGKIRSCVHDRILAYFRTRKFDILRTLIYLCI